LLLPVTSPASGVSAWTACSSTTHFTATVHAWLELPVSTHSRPVSTCLDCCVGANCRHSKGAARWLGASITSPLPALAPRLAPDLHTRSSTRRLEPCPAAVMVLYSFYIFDRHSKSALRQPPAKAWPVRLHAADRIVTSGVHLLAPMDTTARLVGQGCAPPVRLEHHQQWRRRPGPQGPHAVGRREARLRARLLPAQYGHQARRR
jgi:hypothetical protein